MRSTTLLGLAPAAAIQVALGGDTINATLYDKLNFDFIQQSIKEGKGLSCRTLAANAVRLQLHALAYDLGNFLRTLATPEPIKDWSLTSLKEKLIKIGAKVVSHGRYVVFQMAEVAIPRQRRTDRRSRC